MLNGIFFGLDFFNVLMMCLSILVYELNCVSVCLFLSGMLLGSGFVMLISSLLFLM